MLSRRLMLSGLLGCACALRLGKSARADAVLGDDGLYKVPWFLQSFLELGDDLEGAAARGKRFAIIWEVRSCPYCKETHLVNFANPEIADYIKQRFDILQLNMQGSREVVDFDGEKLTEKRLAEKYGIRFSPTVQFFPERAATLAEKKPRAREVARLQGYLAPAHFLAFFKFVAERAYERGSLRDYLRSGT